VHGGLWWGGLRECTSLVGAPVRVPGRGGTFPAVPAFPIKSSRFTHISQAQ
jgi:hypothetical protein